MKNFNLFTVAICLFLFLFISPCSTVQAKKNNPAKEFSADLIVYGGTSAGIIAAVEMVQSGKTVIVVSPDKHLGGLTSGGLGFTDTGNKSVIGELAREFYHEEWLDRKDGVIKKAGKIISFKTLSGKSFSGKVFIDATYEGDLMASAVVSYVTGHTSFISGNREECREYLLPPKMK